MHVAYRSPKMVKKMKEIIFFSQTYLINIYQSLMRSLIPDTSKGNINFVHKDVPLNWQKLVKMRRVYDRNYKF